MGQSRHKIQGKRELCGDEVSLEPKYNKQGKDPQCLRIYAPVQGEINQSSVIECL